MSERKVFEDSVTPLPAQEGLTHNGLMVNAAAPEHRDQNMTLLFSLAIPPEAQKRLEESVARGKVIPLDDLNRDYSPDAADVEKLVDWLKSEGYEIKQVSPDSTSVYARASVDKIEQSLGVNMVRVTKDGLTYTAAQNAPSLPADADLKAFWQRNNLPTDTSRIERVNVKGGPLAPPEGEETLDVQWSSGIAPDAKVRVYASGSLRFVDLDLALDRIIADLPGRPGMRQLSISLGLGETFMGGPQGEVAVQHQKFLRLAAAGVNVFVSSGDAGSNPDVTGHGTGSVSQAEYESSDPTVIGVGGTTLTLTSGGDIASETGWTGSGGGTSIFFSRPSWQTGQGVPPGGMRLVPDVSLAADPDKGAFIVLNGNVMQIGGTSWSAPVWAGFCALINEARAKANKPPLPFLNPLIYPLMGTSCFRDIKAGNNGAFDAGPGYDMITGIGVPNVKELIQALT